MLATVVLFVVYLNVPAVAVREYGLPFMFGAAIPLLLAVPVAYRVLVRGEPLRVPSLLLAAAALLVIQGVSALFAIHPHESLSFVIEWALEGVLLAALVINVFRTRADILAGSNALIAAGCVMGGIVLLQQALGATDQNFYGFGQLDAHILDETGDARRRLAGPIGETNRFAQIMAVLIPLAVAMGIAARGLRRAGYLLAAAIITGGMALAYSRGAIVALALAVPFALMMRVVRWRHVAVGAMAAVALLSVLPHYAERVVSIGQVAAQTIGLAPGGLRNADGAARGRMTEMMASGLLFVDHPVLGAGPGMAEIHYPRYAAMVGGKVRPGTRRSHNLFLQVAAETGILGLIAFLAVIGYAFVGLERSRRRFDRRDRTLWAVVCGLELALIVLLASSLFLHAAYIRYFWLLLGMCAAAAAVDDAPVLIRVLGRLLGQTALRLRAQT